MPVSAVVACVVSAAAVATAVDAVDVYKRQVMSGGQYELKRRREAADVRSQSGLDLNVIDHYNGSERSANTLSGGEAFLASLALALGLSDEVQASAGGIRLDTLFVDEGFGSLSENSLDLAMQALAEMCIRDSLCPVPGRSVSDTEYSVG